MLCELVAAVLCTSQLPPELLALSRIKRTVEARLARTPDYVCLETVERSTRRSTTQEFKPVDIFRLEVGHAGKQEVFSWPGSEAFVAQLPTKALGSGMFSTGEFDSHLRTIFQSGATTIRYVGEEDLHGRRTLHYSFRVPAFAAGLQISVAGASGQAAAAGSFWADAESLEVVRIEVQADEIPPNVPVSGVVSRIDYARVMIGPRYVWLPQAADALMTHDNGEQNQNRIEFSHCRQFQATSVLSFDEPSPPTAALPGDEQLSIPRGLLLVAKLEAEINSSGAVVGDLVTARVDADVVRKGAVLVPKGAVLKGRLRRLDRDTKPEARYTVALEFLEIEARGKRARFYGRLEKLEAVGTETMAHRDLPGVATFVTRGAQFRLPPGTSMVWKTTDAENRDR